VDKVSSKTCLISDLTRELADFRIAASPLNPEFHFVDRLSEVNECRVVKANERRRLYHLQAPDGGYFLKCSAPCQNERSFTAFYFVSPTMG
jgi:hypothetical protein